MAAKSTLELTPKSELSELPRIAEEIKKHGNSYNWPVRWIRNVTLALDELFTNIVNYSQVNKSEKNSIRLFFKETEDRLEVVLEDSGVAFNPFEEAAPPPLDSSLEDRPVGGLGVYFVKQLIDEVNYERLNERNRIVLVQHASN